MEPVDITILAIQNPGSEETVIVSPQRTVSPQQAADEYGSQIQQGAFVTLIDRSPHGNTVGVTVLVADRNGDVVYLQTNDAIADNEVDIDAIGRVVAESYNPEPKVELETFTVFGNNDDGDDFVAVVSATEDTVHDVGVQAGLVDAGFEGSVTISCILKGDHGDAAIHYII
jgi:hypothetical protein